jgi:hypothetical protein
MEKKRSGTIVFDEAVATMRSAAPLLTNSFQCMVPSATVRRRDCDDAVRP